MANDRLKIVSSSCSGDDSGRSDLATVLVESQRSDPSKIQDGLICIFERSKSVGKISDGG